MTSGVPRVQYAQTELGASVAYGVSGRGPLLIVLPGTLPMSNFQKFPGALRLFGLADIYTVAMYDHLGAGLSDRETYDYSPDGLQRELEAVIADLEAKRYSVMGQASTGSVAIRHAITHADEMNGLVLANAWARGSDYTGNPRFSSYRAALEGDWETASETFTRVLLQLSGARARDVAATVRETTSSDAYHAYLDAVSAEDVTDLLPDVAVPTLIAQTAESFFHSVDFGRELAARIPRARLEIYDSFTATSLVHIIRNHQAEEAAGKLTSAQAASGGFKTILFTDLESSAALTTRLGDEQAQELLRGHNATVRAALEEHGGREVKHTGDGIMASFPSAVSAVQASLAIQRGLAGGEVRVRVGLNAGEPIAEDDDLFGAAVIKASRICDRAEPGQVLVSRVVMELCEGKTFDFTSVGDATLKGFDEPVALYEVSPG